MDIEQKFSFRIFFIVFIYLISLTILPSEKHNNLFNLFSDEKQKNFQLDQYKIYYNSAVINKNSIDVELSGVSKLGSYIYEVEKNQLRDFESFDKSKKLYVIENSINKKIMFTDGSIIIKFKQLPNLQAFADKYSLVLKEEFLSIKRGVFTIPNIQQIKLITSEISFDENVELIELNILDPRIAPN